MRYLKALSAKDTKEKFKNYAQLINQKSQKKRYLSKNNQNIRRLELISKITQLRNWRIVKKALWLDQMYFLHIFDSDFKDPKN